MNCRTVLTPSKIILILVFNMLLLTKGQENNRKGRDFQSYLPLEVEKRPDHHILSYPHNFQFNDDYVECAKNPMLPLLGKGLNLLLLKLGVFGIIKTLLAFIFAGFLVKIPLLLLKLAFFKSFFIPFLVAPLLVHIFTSHMSPPSEDTSEGKPNDTSTEMPGLMGMNEMTMAIGRQLNNNLTSLAWDSMKMLVESDQCAERISCMIGASSKDSTFGNIFARMLKYLHYSTPPPLQKKATLIREAFSKGSRSSACSGEDYKCQGPELMLQYGVKKLKIF